MSTNPALKPTPQEEAIIAAVPKDALKAMFYLFAGKPDSKVKLFNRPIFITPDDIQDLNKKVVDKLRLHQIETVIASATLNSTKRRALSLGRGRSLLHSIGKQRM